MSSNLLLRNARIGLGGPLRDILITGGRVAAVRESVTDHLGEAVDLEGATVLPGLWDAHVHSAQWAQARRRIDLSGARSAREAADLMAANLPPSGEVIMGYGFRDALWPDEPDRGLLPEARPVVLISNDLHTVWFSGAALALVGLGGHPTGVLHEAEGYHALVALPAPPAELLDRWVATSTGAAAARGVTGMLDFELADNVTDWLRRHREQEVAVRVACSIPRAGLDEAIARGLRTGDVVAGSGGLLEVGPVKMFVDGSLNTRTAYCDDPYPGSGGRGRLETPLAELAEVMALAARHGLHPAVHAIGDLATSIALDAFERVGCPGRIEHAQLVRPADFGRFARPGLIAGVQPAHAPDDREVADTHWHGRTGRAYAYADLLAAGATLEIGSDAPVAPLDPWDGIASAVTRTDDERPPWHPEQAVPLRDALAAAARGRSTVRAGDPADLMILARDPSLLTPEELRRPEVLGTLMDGRWTHRPPLRLTKRPVD
ncbi:amidohydrolase family protein [Acrocarpospora macrocephala]|uniref:Amidohydrolase n=1 Tax=Acrocarpospora macrocephala TaxID=150177 RepID=A0A5M3WNP9_9ACTN|nr:amidohydrolase family protein [Acrocarpospora macrocephala]GES09769.1 amidohydrolase [Acrocarpospora macrocephala]